MGTHFGVLSLEYPQDHRDGIILYSITRHEFTKLKPYFNKRVCETKKRTVEMTQNFEPISISKDEVLSLYSVESIV
jgi:hypothetical protein